ncbi:MAG: GTP cyclohydrolase I FolE [Chloracidobacterium sp. CP2_5A]|nr:MAG: GTP cyclohydrolase I FolE [Chloracidobacterium sp. CP2_5A]
MPDNTEQTKPETLAGGGDLLTAARALRRMLATLRLTPDRDPHLERTAENVAEFWAEFFAPFIAAQPPPPISAFPAGEMAGQFVAVGSLPFHSLCAHHLTPFFGAAHVAYVPDKLGIGIGAPAKLLEYAARRPQLQERLAADVATALEAACRPRGVAVCLVARQMCMEMRGARAEGRVESVVLRGCFQEAAWRDQFFNYLARQATD